jgi:Skp family chaperone for outer membrane proteins
MTTTTQTTNPAVKTTAKKASAKKIDAAVNSTVQSAKNVEATVKSTVNSAKTEVTEQATSILGTLNTSLASAQDAAQKVWFAGLGVMGRSVEEAQGRYSKANQELQTRYTKINKDSQKLVADLVVRGEKVQDEAEVRLKEGRANIEEQIETAKNRLVGLVSVVDIPARFQNVSKKLETLSKDFKKSA